MERVIIQYHDLSDEKQQEILEALDKVGAGDYALDSTHEIFIHCNFTEEGVDFE